MIGPHQVLTIMEEPNAEYSRHDNEAVPNSLVIANSSGGLEDRIEDAEQRSNANREAAQTWEVGRTLGLHSAEEERVLQELGKINNGQDMGDEKTMVKQKKGRSRKKN